MTTPSTHHPASDLLFRLGFSGIFLVNGVIGLLDPSSYIKLMQSSLLTQWIPDYDQITQLIAINDICLGMLVLIAPHNRLLQAWAGLWLLGVVVLKVSTLVT